MGGRLFCYGFLVSTLMACASGGGKGGTFHELFVKVVESIHRPAEYV
jgi:hypothetical protein